MSEYRIVRTYYTYEVQRKSWFGLGKWCTVGDPDSAAVFSSLEEAMRCIRRLHGVDVDDVVKADE
jgi:hypothetical protein